MDQCRFECILWAAASEVSPTSWYAQAKPEPFPYGFLIPIPSGSLELVGVAPNKAKADPNRPSWASIVLGLGKTYTSKHRSISMEDLPSVLTTRS